MEQADAKVEVNNSNARRATVIIIIYYYYYRVYLIIVNLYTTYTGLLALIFMNS